MLFLVSHTAHTEGLVNSYVCSILKKSLSYLLVRINAVPYCHRMSVWESRDKKQLKMTEMIENTTQKLMITFFFFLESGRIFTFGLNEWGQLGLGDTSPRDKPSCIKGK